MACCYLSCAKKRIKVAIGLLGDCVHSVKSFVVINACTVNTEKEGGWLLLYGAMSIERIEEFVGKKEGLKGRKN
jgi:hypothetical protein